MTPERWRRIGELFEAAVQIDPAGREAWLRAACGGDDELRTEVSRLLAQHEREHRSVLLTPPQAAGPPSDRAASGPPRSKPPRTAGAGRWSGDAPANESGGLAPRQAIASQKEQQTIAELTDAVRARLRELAVVYILILAASTLWSRGVLGRDDVTIARVDGAIILALVGLIALLRSRSPISLTSLQALELGAVGLLAGRVTFVEYRLMLRFSQR